MKKRILFIILICCLFVNSTAFAAQIRKKTGYLTFEKDGNKMTTTYYLVNDKGSRISTQEYDYLEMINPNLFIAKINDKYGLINGAEVRKTPFNYEEINCFKSNVLRIKEEGKFGLMDYSGNILITPEYSLLEKIDDRIMKMTPSSETSTKDTATKDTVSLVGLMDFSGKIIMQPKYSYIDKINNHMLRVIISDSTSSPVQTPVPQPNTPQPNSSGGKKYGLIDYNGRVILGANYDYINKVSNTILKVKKGSSWGRIEYYNGNIINIMFDYQSYW